MAKKSSSLKTLLLVFGAIAAAGFVTAAMRTSAAAIDKLRTDLEKR